MYSKKKCSKGSRKSFRYVKKSTGKKIHVKSACVKSKSLRSKGQKPFIFMRKSSRKRKDGSSSRKGSSSPRRKGSSSPRRKGSSSTRRKGSSSPNLQVEKSDMNIPDDLVGEVSGYLTNMDRIRFGNTGKRIDTFFTDNRKYRKYSLVGNEALKYIMFENIRNRINRKGTVIYLSLHLEDLNLEQMYRDLNLKQEYFEIGDIDLDLDVLKGIPKVSIADILNITDVSALSKAHTVTLRSLYDVEDVSDLSTVHTLTLDDMWWLQDVSALSTVHTLTLKEMDRVTDVSALSTVHTLTLKNMRGVTDVSALSTVHTLTLDSLDGVTDVSALSTVHKLILKNMPII
jgi:hypothetical protein